MTTLLAPTSQAAESSAVTVGAEPVTFVLVASSNAPLQGVTVDIVIECSNGTRTTVYTLTESEPAIAVTAAGVYRVRKPKTDRPAGVDTFVAA